MKNRFLTILTTLSISCFLFRCADDSVETQQETPIDPAIIEQLKAYNLDASNMYTKTIFNPISGKEEQFYVVENDILVTEDQMERMLSNSESEARVEQYRTRNLVALQGNSIRTIRVVGEASTLTTNMRQALLEAVNNYNALNLAIRFEAVISNNFTNADIVVTTTDQLGDNFLAIAGFPANGNPFEFILLGEIIPFLSVQKIEEIITHELGHTIGLRHTDWYNRTISCGDEPDINPFEGEAGVGAISIPGTPNLDPNSVMLACTSLDFNRELSVNDIYALQEIYGAYAAIRYETIVSVLNVIC